MSVVSTSTTHLASTDGFISLPSTASATDAATSTIVLSSVSESAGSSTSQATFSSSDTTLTSVSITAAPLNSDLSSSANPFTSPSPSSSYKPSAAIITSPSLHTNTTSSQITVTSDANASPFIETTLQTSFSNSESIDSSQIEVSSGLTTSDTPSSKTFSGASPPASSHTTFVSETTPTSTHVFTSPRSGATSHTASSDSSSINQISRMTFTPSATSDPFPHIHSHAIQETGEDPTPTINSPYTDLIPNTSGREKHNSVSSNTGASTQSPILGTATDTNTGSSWSIQGTPIQGTYRPSDVITSPPTMNTPSHSQTKHSNVGLTSLSLVPVDSATPAYQSSSLTALESELSTSTPFVRLRNTMQDGAYTIYTTTFTSLKTLFTITTITASPTPTTVTTSIPYLTETEVITTTFVAYDTADAVTATIVVPASKAGDVRLSKAQIGGITAGAVGFFAVLAAILIYLILRKRWRNFAPVPPNKISYPESDAEMGEDDGHDFRQSIGQVPASTSGSDFVVLPSSRQLRHNTPRVSSSPFTISYQHPSRTESVDSTNDLTTVYAQPSSVDNTNHSDEVHSTESSSYFSAQTATTESLASESSDLPVDPLSRRISQSSRMAYEKEIERLRQEVLSQTDRIRYMDEQMELMHTRSPPPSYRSSSRSAISAQTSRSSLSLPPPLPSREISY